MQIRSGLAECALVVAFALSLSCCTRPAPEPPGPEAQQRQHPERNPADQPTVPPENSAIGAAESTDDPDSPGTTRTPPAASARPMDEPPQDSTGTALDPNVTTPGAR
jgi:hypothetical protein